MQNNSTKLVDTILALLLFKGRVKQYLENTSTSIINQENPLLSEDRLNRSTTSHYKQKLLYLPFIMGLHRLYLRANIAACYYISYDCSIVGEIQLI